MTDADKLAYCRSFLRREYAGKLADLQQLARDVFNSATQEVALTSTNFEGGGAGGTFKFDKIILGHAIESVLTEMDTNGVVTPSQAGSGLVLQFSS